MRVGYPVTLFLRRWIPFGDDDELGMKNTGNEI